MYYIGTPITRTDNLVFESLRFEHFVTISARCRRTVKLLKNNFEIRGLRLQHTTFECSKHKIAWAQRGLQTEIQSPNKCGKIGGNQKCISHSLRDYNILLYII